MNIYQASDHVKEFLADVDGVVEATNTEKTHLWMVNKHSLYGQKPREWKELLSGYGTIVGYLAEMPVFISLLKDTIDGKNILFWFATSQVVDYRMIEQWMEENIPERARKDGRINQVDAGNFNNVFRD